MVKRASRLGVVPVVLVLATVVSACDLLRFVSPIDEIGPSASPVIPISTSPPTESAPASTGLPQATLPPSAPAEDRDALWDRLQADGWRAVEVPQAGIRLLLPAKWALAVKGDTSLGDFSDLPSDSERPAEARRAFDGSDLLLLYAQGKQYLQTGEHPVILHLTAWRNTAYESNHELMEFLIDARVDRDTTWYETATVRTGIGPGERLHWWSKSLEGDSLSTTEIVFHAPNPNGEPYTLSILTDDELAAETWASFELIAASLAPLD
jgi:hypothetical protein